MKLIFVHYQVRAFDKSYIDHEVAYHKAVIGVIEGQLIPGAHKPRVKGHLDFSCASI